MHDIRHGLVSTASSFAIQRAQEVPDDFLKSLSDARAASSARAGEMHQVCSVPVAVVEAWLADGFDIYKEPARAILARLRREDLSAFITTTKRI